MSTSRAKELECILREASDLYYNGGQSNLSDSEFDRLRDELEEIDPHNKFLATVGIPSTDVALQKVKHSMPMGSLKKITTLKEYDTWLNTVSKTVSPSEIAIQYKMDGTSISLCFENGKFVQAITRGDGLVGDDVTHTIKNASGFPRKINVSGKVFVRCECTLPIPVWKKHFSDTANPRNAAAGLVRRLDGDGSEHLACTAFDVLFGNTFSFATEMERIDWLKNAGFDHVPTQVVSCDRDAIEKAIKKVELLRPGLPVEIDGAVLKANRVADQVKLGEHDGRPYWARAWKFAPMGGHTTLDGVEWSVGTHGTINPVAKVAPVAVGGTTIQNVTLHNMDEIERLGVCIGDEVEVIRAGDVIPKICRVVRQGKTRQPIVISKCPSCGSQLDRDGPRLLCSNKDNCNAVQLSRIKKWIAKREIMHLGDANIELLFSQGVVSSIADLYRLTCDEMVEAGLGRRMSEKIFAEIEKSRQCSLADLLGSLSLDMLGRSEAANLIEQGIDTLDQWKSLAAEQIESFPGYQETKANRIASAVRKNWSTIASVASLLSISAVKTTAAFGKLQGMSFCFTGAMENPRKDLERMAIDAGGEVRSVSKELKYLVIADPSSTSSKAVKARQLGINLISEKQFLQMCV